MSHTNSLVHFGFTVSNLVRTKEFFRDCLGFEVAREEHGPAGTGHIVGVPGATMDFCVLQGPDHAIELIQYSAPDDRQQVESRSCDTGVAHVAYLVPDIEAFIADAAAYEVRPLNTTLLFRKEGAYGVYMRDPDGLTIEILQMASA